MNPSKAILMLIIIGILIYFNSLFNGFVWDDEEQVLNNSLVYSFSNFPRFFSGSTFNSGGSGALGGLYYKPLMTTAFSLIYTIFGPNAFFFHLFQIILHIANASLVFLVFNHLLSFKKTKQTFLAFILSLIFLIHPINTETVVYVSDLQDILFFFFGMLALWWVMNKGIEKSRDWIVLTISLLASLLSKETGALFYFIITAYLCFFQKLLFNLKRILIWSIPTLTSLAVYSLLRFEVAKIFFNKHGLSPITIMPLTERIVSIPKIILFYLTTFLWPANLAINQHWAVKTINLPDFYFPLVLNLIFFSLLAIFSFYLYKKNRSLMPLYLFFLFWFLISLGMHLQIFPLDLTVSDRWFYLPMVGLLGIIGIFLQQIKISRFFVSKLFVVLILFLIIALSARTIIRNTNWQNGLALYSNDVLISKDAFDLENNLGVELYRAKRFDEAKQHFEKSTKLAPNWWTNWNNLGVIEEQEGNIILAKSFYQKAIDNGRYYLAYENVAKITLYKENDPKSAKEFSESSLKILPENPTLWIVLSISNYLLEDKQNALMAAQKAYLLAPSPQTYYLYYQLSNNLLLEIQK